MLMLDGNVVEHGISNVCCAVGRKFQRDRISRGIVRSNRSPFVSRDLLWEWALQVEPHKIKLLGRDLNVLKAASKERHRFVAVLPTVASCNIAAYRAINITPREASSYAVVGYV